VVSAACTQSDGTLSFAEIQNIIQGNGTTDVVMTYDKDAQVKYITYDTVRLPLPVRRTSYLIIALE
jgi:hypothetical protein